LLSIEHEECRFKNVFTKQLIGVLLWIAFLGNGNKPAIIF